MSVQKAAFNVGENSLHIGMNFSKVDQQNRLVSGFATLDNADNQNDLVLAEASAHAFERFRGNLREMHQPIAAGHMVNFSQETYFDPKTEKFYEGIYATVYVSLGAPLTWEKVLDGTLTGFSIGGDIVDAESVYSPELKKSVRFIKDYNLVELSLVDNPANQLANVFSITKSADGTTTMTGMITETQTENVFYCRVDDLVKTSTEATIVCPNCADSMEAAGWFEYDDSTKTEKLRDVVQKYLATSDNTQGEPAHNEGGVDVVVEDTIEKAAEVTEEEIPVVEQGKAEHEVPASENAPEEVAEVVAPAEPVADVSEVVNAEDDLAKMFSGLKTDINESLEKNASVLQEALGGLSTRLDTVTTDVESKNSDLMEKFTTISTELAELKTRLGETEKSLTVIDGATALRKSSDLGGSTEVVVDNSTASAWGGHFLGADSL